MLERPSRSPGSDGGGRSEQGRYLADLKRPEKSRAVDESQRKRHRRLVFEHRALAERRDQARRRILARDPAEPWDHAIERAQRGPDLPFRHDALDIEHFEDLLDPDDGHLEIAVETAARRERERAGTHG